jgi:glycine hydroxymethyltransferase
VLEAQGSVLTNKYAEGYPGKRYYGGCEHVDVAENARDRDRAKALFGADYANVQPHSGSQANRRVHGDGLKPGDTHPRHVARARRPPDARCERELQRQALQRGAYGLDTGTEAIDYDAGRALAREHKPKHDRRRRVCLRAAHRLAALPRDRDAVGAYLMVDMAHYAGLIAAGLYPSPVGIADFVTSTTHKTLRGPRGGIILAKAEHEKKLNSMIFPGIQGGPLMHVIAAKAVALQGRRLARFQGLPAAGARQCEDDGRPAHRARTAHRVGSHRIARVPARPARQEHHRQGCRGCARPRAHHVNKNAIPNDPQKPFVTSGIRVGSPAMTTRGFKTAEAKQVANLVADVLEAPNDDANIARVTAQVKALTSAFPVYGRR